MLLIQIWCSIILVSMEATYTTVYAVDESKWYLKITYKAWVKFSIGAYMDSVDCDVVPVSACHLLLGRPWQFDLNATHEG